MSMPAIIITCDRCDYSGSTGVCFGIFKYQTQLGKISLPRTLGWCESCKSLAPIECSEQWVRFESLKDDIASLESSLAEEIVKEKSSWPLLARLFSKRQPDSEAIRLIRTTIANLSQELARPAVLADYLLLKGGAHCLSCGCLDVFPYPQLPVVPDDYYGEDRTPKAIGIQHPECGGEMYAAISDIRINRKFSERLYTLNGERIV